MDNALTMRYVIRGFVMRPDTPIYIYNDANYTFCRPCFSPSLQSHQAWLLNQAKDQFITVQNDARNLLLKEKERKD